VAAVVPVSKTENSFFYDTCWPVLHLDNHLLAVYKPSGLLVQGDRTGDVSLLDLGKKWLKKRFNKPGNVFLGLVHRLDRPVAGVVLFARTSKAASRLSQQFRERSVEKQYLAVVPGLMPKESDRLEHYLERHHRSCRVVEKRTRRSQKAILYYRVLDKIGKNSLVQIRLETGRRHQIRVQLAHIGHPLLGDMKYGTEGPFSNGQIALLARKLTVTHPTLEKRISFLSPLPASWPWKDEGEAGAVRPPWTWQTFREKCEGL